MAIELKELAAPSTHLAGNDIWVKAETSGIPAGATDYKILLKIVSTDDVLTGSPFIDAITPDAAGVAWFNFSGYVNQGIRSQLNWPIKGRYSGKIITYTDYAYDIWLYGGERYIDSNGNLVEQFEEVALQPFFIMPGKLPARMVAELNMAGKTWWKKYCDEGEFFSYMPTTQQVTPFQPVKLWWIPPTTPLSVVIKLKYYLQDGTSDVIDLFTGDLYYDMLTEMEYHPVNAGVPYAAANLPVKYEAWIESAGEVVCAKRTFVINWQPPVDKYYYLFADNRMGGIECLGLTGACTLEPSGERVVVSVPFERGQDIRKATRLAKAGVKTRKWKINSGWKPKEELAAMDFLLDSPHAWLAIPPLDGDPDISKYSLTPIVITNTQLVLGDDMKDVESIDIELTEAL